MALVLLGALCIPAPALAEETASAGSRADDETDDNAESDADTATKKARPKAKTKRVRVEASLPYVPRTNTIGTRLDISPLWTPFHLGTVNTPLLDDQFHLQQFVLLALEHF